MCGAMDDGYIFKLTLLARVNFTPHKPYYIIVASTSDLYCSSFPMHTRLVATQF